MEQHPRVVRIHPKAVDAATLAEAGRLLRAGQAVAFPTETVYGLGANALDPQAVRRIFRAKGRPADNPLIVHIADATALHLVARDVPPAAQVFMDRFWPGPLTLVLPKADAVPDIVTAGGRTIAVRCPDHEVARALIRAAGVPLAAPSANRSGRPSPTRAEHVAADLGADVAMILDGGPTQLGVESTVLDLTLNPPVVLRLGAITLEMLQDVVPSVKVHVHAVGAATPTDTPVASPGLKHRHYAPQTPLYLYAGKDARGVLQNAVQVATDNGERLGLLLSTETAAAFGSSLHAHVVLAPGARDDASAWAAALFHALRTLDASGVARILVEGIPEKGLGATVMERLRRAAYSPEDDY